MPDNFIEIMKPFGPSVARTKIPDEMIKKINDYVDKIIEDKKKSEALDHGKSLAGNVTQEFLLEKNFSDIFHFDLVLFPSVNIKSLCVFLKRP